jgi:colanic acid biosynthesis glycosyl transferase WcaI
LRIQLWSYNYDPEPTGIAPLSTVWAQEMRRRGHDVDVVAAHPHYPEPRWGHRLRPYREVRDGIPVVRLPIWPGRESTLTRMRQELSFTAAQTLALPALRRPDVLVSVSPSFPALIPAMIDVRLRRIPWVLWLQDLLPDGAAATGQIKPGPVLRASRWLERTAYRTADHIVVISETFRENLLAKGVPSEKITRIYNWATRPAKPAGSLPVDEPRILCMGNIGQSQGLEQIVRAFESEPRLSELGARFVIAGTGVATDEVRAAITTDRVVMTGLLFGDDLDKEIRRSTIGAVTQHYSGVEFNVPSKLMNYMAFGLPVVASVRLESEVARIIEASGCGWVTDAARPEEFARKVADVLHDTEELVRRGGAGLEFAQRELTPERAGEVSAELLATLSRTGAG